MRRGWCLCVFWGDLFLNRFFIATYTALFILFMGYVSFEGYISQLTGITGKEQLIWEEISQRAYFKNLIVDHRGL